MDWCNNNIFDFVLVYQFIIYAIVPNLDFHLIIVCTHMVAVNIVCTHVLECSEVLVTSAKVFKFHSHEYSIYC